MAEKQEAIITNLRGGRIEYRLGDGEGADFGFLEPGENRMPVGRAKAILGATHHTPRKRGTAQPGKPVTNRQAWEAGCIGSPPWIAVSWPEPDAR